MQKSFDSALSQTTYLFGLNPQTAGIGMCLRKLCRRFQEYSRGSALRVILRLTIAPKHSSYHLNINVFRKCLLLSLSLNLSSRVITTPSVIMGQNEVSRGQKLIETAQDA